MKTAIVYYSKHHGNTKKLLDAIAKDNEVTLIDVLENPYADLKDYDRIGFASGIYFSKFHKSLLSFAKERLPEGKSVFFIYTCGAAKDSYTASIEEVCRAKKSKLLGSFGCLGFDTYGPFKLIGGVAKGHPDSSDLADAVAFYGGL